MSEKLLQKVKNDHISVISAVLMQSQHGTKDLTLICGDGNPVEVSRTVVCTFSPFLSNLLDGVPSHLNKVILLPDISSLEMKQIIETLNFFLVSKRIDRTNLNKKLVDLATNLLGLNMGFKKELIADAKTIANISTDNDTSQNVFNTSIKHAINVTTAENKPNISHNQVNEVGIIQGSMTPLPRSTIPLSRSTTPLPRSTTPLPRSTTPLPRSTTPLPGSTTPLPRSTTPLPKSTTPLQKSTTPLPRSMTPLPRSMTHLPKSTTPLQKSMTPFLRSTTPSPNLITPSLKSMTPSTKSMISMPTSMIPLPTSTNMSRSTSLTLKPTSSMTEPYMSSMVGPMTTTSEQMSSIVGPMTTTSEQMSSMVEPMGPIQKDVGINILPKQSNGMNILTKSDIEVPLNPDNETVIYKATNEEGFSRILNFSFKGFEENKLIETLGKIIISKCQFPDPLNSGIRIDILKHTYGKKRDNSQESLSNKSFMLVPDKRKHKFQVTSLNAKGDPDTRESLAISKSMIPKVAMHTASNGSDTSIIKKPKDEVFIDYNTNGLQVSNTDEDRDLSDSGDSSEKSDLSENNKSRKENNPVSVENNHAKEIDISKTAVLSNDSVSKDNRKKILTKKRKLVHENTTTTYKKDNLNDVHDNFAVCYFLPIGWMLTNTSSHREYRAPDGKLFNSLKEVYHFLNTKAKLENAGYGNKSSEKESRFINNKKGSTVGNEENVGHSKTIDNLLASDSEPDDDDITTAIKSLNENVEIESTETEADTDGSDTEASIENSEAEIHIESENSKDRIDIETREEQTCIESDVEQTEIECNDVQTNFENCEGLGDFESEVGMDIESGPTQMDIGSYEMLTYGESDGLQLDIVSEEKQLDTKTDKQHFHHDSDEQELDIESDEQELDIESDEQELEIESDEQELEIESDEKQLDIENDEQELDIESDEQEFDMESDEQLLDIERNEQQLDMGNDGQHLNIKSDDQNSNIKNYDQQEYIENNEQQLDIKSDKRQLDIENDFSNSETDNEDEQSGDKGIFLDSDSNIDHNDLDTNLSENMPQIQKDTDMEGINSDNDDVFSDSENDEEDGFSDPEYFEKNEIEEKFANETSIEDSSRTAMKMDLLSIKQSIMDLLKSS